MTDKPSTVPVVKENASGTAPCTATISLRQDQALFSLECPTLSNMKVLGQAPGTFPVGVIPSLQGTLYYFADEKALATANVCWVMQKETLISAADSICLAFGTADNTMALFEGNNPPSQDYEWTGSAQVIFYG